MYAGILTIVCGGILAVASEGLKEKQQFNIDMEQKKNIRTLDEMITLMVLSNFIESEFIAGLFNEGSGSNFI